MLAPTGGSVYDPACGSGGMFVQSDRFLVEHGGQHGDLSIYGQESNPTTWRLARMNLALRGLDGDLGPEHADSFHHDLHPDLRADYVLANPPFNTKDWGAARLQDDPRWRFGVPPAQNANFAWVSHIIHHMAPARPRRLRARQRRDDHQQRRRGRDPPRDRRGRPRRLHGRAAGPAVLQHADPRVVVAARARQGRPAPARPSRPRPDDRRPRPRRHGRPHPPRARQPAEIERLVGLYHGWRGDPGAHERLPRRARPVSQRAARRDRRARARARARPLRRLRGPPRRRCARSPRSSPTSTPPCGPSSRRPAPSTTASPSCSTTCAARHDRAPSRLGPLHPRRHQGPRCPTRSPAVRSARTSVAPTTSRRCPDVPSMQSMPSVPVIRGANLGAGERRFYTDDLVFVSAAKADLLARHIARPGDVIVTQRGTLEQVGLVPADTPWSRFILSQSQMKITVDPARADPEYIYYWLLTPEIRDYVARHTISAGVPHTNLAILRADPRPPAPAGPATGDRPRARHHRRPRRAGHQHGRRRSTAWSACSFGHGSWNMPRRTAARSGQLHPATSFCEAALFPSTRAAAGPLGPLPTGWTRRAADRVRELPKRHALHRRRLLPARHGKPIIKIGEIKRGITDQTRWAEDPPGARAIDDGDLLMSWSGNPHSSIGTFLWHGGPAWLNQHIFKVVPPPPRLARVHLLPAARAAAALRPARPQPADHRARARQPKRHADAGRAAPAPRPRRGVRAPHRTRVRPHRRPWSTHPHPDPRPRAVLVS